MHTQGDIEASIRGALSIIFGKSESVDPQDFRSKFAGLVDFATNASEPILKPETLRYQSILIYWTLILLTLHYFRVGKFKIADAILDVDRRLFLVYSIFLVAVAAIFLIKSYIDYQRSTFAREKHSTAVSELQLLMSIGRMKRMLQEHFWLEIFDAIGRTYETYSSAMDEILERTESRKHMDMRVSKLDLAKASEVPELKAEIETQQSYLSTMKAALEKDVTRLRQRVESMPQAKHETPDEWPSFSSHDKFTAVRKAFDETLGRWFEARNNLTSEHLHLKIQEVGESPELRQLDAMLNVLTRTARIRRVYGALEVASPVLFAAFGIAFVWYSPA